MQWPYSTRIGMRWFSVRERLEFILISHQHASFDAWVPSCAFAVLITASMANVNTFNVAFTAEPESLEAAANGKAINYWDSGKWAGELMRWSVSDN